MDVRCVHLLAVHGQPVAGVKHNGSVIEPGATHSDPFGIEKTAVVIFAVDPVAGQRLINTTPSFTKRFSDYISGTWLRRGGS